MNLGKLQHRSELVVIVAPMQAHRTPREGARYIHHHERNHQRPKDLRWPKPLRDRPIAPARAEASEGREVVFGTKILESTVKDRFIPAERP